MSKKVIVLRGSEDGNIGVYSNFKAAHKAAVKYLSHNFTSKIQNGMGSYPKAVKEFKKRNWLMIESFDSEDFYTVTVEFDTFYVKSK